MMASWELAETPQGASWVPIGSVGDRRHVYIHITIYSAPCRASSQGARYSLFEPAPPIFDSDLRRASGRGQEPYLIRKGGTPVKIRMNFRNETKTCYRFERKDDAGNLTTLYLKKNEIQEAGIDPKNGITLTIEEARKEE